MLLIMYCMFDVTGFKVFWG